MDSPYRTSARPAQEPRPAPLRRRLLAWWNGTGKFYTVRNRFDHDERAAVKTWCSPLGLRGIQPYCRPIQNILKPRTIPFWERSLNWLFERALK